MGLNEDMETSSTNPQELPHVSDEQRKRETMGMRKTNEDDLKEFLRLEERRDAAAKPTLDRIPTNTVKVSLVRSIIESRKHSITSTGSLPDILLTDMPVIRIKNVSLLLRMVHLLPPTLDCVQVLKENLLFYAQHTDEQQDMRLVEWRWAWKMLNCLEKMGRVPLKNKVLIYTFAELAKETEYRHVMGNPGIGLQIVNWLAAEQAREATITGSEKVVGVQYWLDLHKEKLRTACMKKATADMLEAEDEEHTDIVPVLEPEDDCQPLNDVPVLLSLPGNPSGYIMDIGNGRQLTVEPNSPVKIYSSDKKIVLTDETKLQLLEIYILYAPNPLARPSSDSGKSEHLKQLKHVMQLGKGILLDGEDVKTKLDERLIKPDSLAQLLQGIGGKGLSGQKGKAPGKGGLCHIIDEWMMDTGNQDTSIATIRSSAKDIVSWARAKYC